MKIIKFSLFTVLSICAFALKPMQKSAEHAVEETVGKIKTLRVGDPSGIELVFTIIEETNELTKKLQVTSPDGDIAVFIRAIGTGFVSCFKVNRDGSVAPAIDGRTGRMFDGRTSEEVFALWEEIYKTQAVGTQESLSSVAAKASETPSRTGAASVPASRPLRAAGAAASVCSASLSSSSSSSSSSSLSVSCPVDPCPATQPCVMPVVCSSGGPSAAHMLPPKVIGYYTFSAGGYVKERFVDGGTIETMEAIPEEE